MVSLGMALFMSVSITLVIGVVAIGIINLLFGPIIRVIGRASESVLDGLAKVFDKGLSEKPEKKQQEYGFAAGLEKLRDKRTYFLRRKMKSNAKSADAS